MANYTIDDCVINITHGNGYDSTRMALWRWNEKKRDYDTLIDSRVIGYTLWELVSMAEAEATGRDFEQAYWCEELGIPMPEDLD